ncbi:MAG: PKD domain-containing protein [Planctomycetota bacterium]
MSPLRLVLLSLLLVATSSCSSGLGHGNSSGDADGSPTPTGSLLQAYDLGVTPTGGITDTTVIGAVLSGEAGDLRVAFVAFASEAPADELIAPAPVDANGASDIYVTAVVNLASADGTPTAFNQALLEVFRHPRCETCHGFPATAPEGHPGGFDPSGNCEGCHNASEIGLAGIEWIAPASVGEDLDFRNKNSVELIDQLEEWESRQLLIDPTFEITDHFGDDSRIFWAIESGAVPLDRPTRETVPVPFPDFLGLVTAWDDAGRPATTASAVRSVELVSRATGGAAANGSSRTPSLAFVLDPTAGPSDPQGTLYVAFTSDANDLPGTGASGVEQVFRAEIDVFVDAGDQLRLVSQPTATRLISHTTSPNQRSNGDASGPVVSSDGETIIYASLATDLIAGFSDDNGPGASDVFSTTGITATQLLSRSLGSATTGGNGASLNPSVDPTGQWVAFASDANNLVSGDSNGVRDVFYRCAPSGCVDATIRRASVRDGGTQASGGTSDHPTIATRSGDIMIAYASTKTDLSSDLSSSGSQIFVTSDDGSARSTLLLSRNQAGEVGDGDSTRPRFAPDGESLVYDSLATNLDDRRTQDRNGASDAFRVELASFASGDFVTERLSVTSSGVEGDGSSTHSGLTQFERTEGSYEDELGMISTDATNLSDSESTDHVLTFLDPNFNPLCAIAVASTTVLVGQVITFDASGTTDPDGDAILSYEWQFGDGNTANGETVDHTYFTFAAFDVTLTVTDVRGAQSVCTVVMQVNPDNNPPVAVPGTYPDTAEDITIAFDGSGSTDPDAGDFIVEYFWDFGNGDTATQSTPGGGAPPVLNYAFPNPGTFTVSLTVTDTFGAMFGGTDTESTTITILDNDAPTCSITGNPGSVVEDTIVAFGSSITDETPGTVNYQWSVSGGTIQGSSTGTSVSILFPNPGTFTVNLDVTDAFTASSSCSTMITVTGAPIPFSDVFDDIIVPFSCAAGGCHDGTQQPDLSDEVTSYAELVTAQPVSGCGDYVVPGNAGASFLVEKLEPAPGCGAQMPDGGPFLNASEIDLVEAWINSGAVQ